MSAGQDKLEMHGRSLTKFAELHSKNPELVEILTAAFKIPFFAAFADRQYAAGFKAGWNAGTRYMEAEEL